jgi:hypothetical protein
MKYFQMIFLASAWKLSLWGKISLRMTQFLLINQKFSVAEPNINRHNSVKNQL